MCHSVVPVVRTFHFSVVHCTYLSCSQKGIVLGAYSIKGGGVLSTEAQKVDAASNGRLQQLVNL